MCNRWCACEQETHGSRPDRLGAVIYTQTVMRAQPPFASRRLSWSRWLVLALMALCLPLQGALAVTMQMGMAMPSSHVTQGQHEQQGQHRSHGATNPGNAAAMPCHNGTVDGMQDGMRPDLRHDLRHDLGSARHERLQVAMPMVHGLKTLKHDLRPSTVPTAQTHSPQTHHPELHASNSDASSAPRQRLTTAAASARSAASAAPCSPRR